MASPQEVQPTVPATQEVQPSEPATQEVYDETVPQDEYAPVEENLDQLQEQSKPNSAEDARGHGSFIHGLSVGLGIGCIATFAVMWISLVFTPQMPTAITYEALLSVFIYPMIYLLAVGLIALTAGIVREYYATRRK